MVRRGLIASILLSGLLTVSASVPVFAVDNSSAGAGATCNKRRCYNECVDAYPKGGGPLATCKQLCDVKPTCGDKVEVKSGTTTGTTTTGTRPLPEASGTLQRK